MHGPYLCPYLPKHRNEDEDEDDDYDDADDDDAAAAEEGGEWNLLVYIPLASHFDRLLSHM